MKINFDKEYFKIFILIISITNMKSNYFMLIFSLSFLALVYSKKNNDLFNDLSMDWFEKDKILSCVEIIHRKLKKDKVNFFQFHSLSISTI